MTRLSLLVVLTAFGFVAQVARVCAQEKKEPTPEPKPVPSLKVGDPAPQLKVTKWLRGQEVKAFEPGKVYVVEFWATWCGPCIAAMPDLSRLQTEYKAKGVTVIGFTSRDLLGAPNHGEKQVTEFVDNRGKKLAYTFAYADEGTTAEAWMTAAGWAKIPCTFVIDKTWRIAYIGHPMYLPEALAKVVEGKATAKEIGAEMAKVETEFKEFAGTYVFSNPKESLGKLQAFETKHPALADFLPSIQIKMTQLPKHGPPGEAKRCAERLIAKATEEKDGRILGVVSSLLRGGDGKEDKELLTVAVKAAEAVLVIDGGKTAHSLLDLADAHFVSGDKAKAKEYARKAREAANGESAAIKEYIEKEAGRLGAEN